MIFSGHDTQMSKSKLDLAWHGSVGGLVFCLKCLVGLCLEWLSFSSSTFVNGFSSFVCLFSPASIQWIQWPDRLTKSSARSCSPKLKFKSHMMTTDDK